jgi:hypothetical protein
VAVGSLFLKAPVLGKEDELAGFMGTNSRTLTVPLSWFPELVNADAEQPADQHLIGDGLGMMGL